jgi:hypothetical protein
VANVRIVATRQIEGGAASQTRSIPVVTAAPLALNSFVSGTWMWANGPGQTNFHVHTAAPEARYAYDMGIHRLVNGQFQSFRGDPAVNESYFAWNQPIRAARAGTVRLVVDEHPDNNGNQGGGEANNEIILEHANRTFTKYVHIRQGSARVALGQTVAAGTLIARVGNAGASSEPHLHFHAFKIDATDRQAAVPVAVNGMRSTTGAPLTGVPKGDTMYQTP